MLQICGLFGLLCTAVAVISAAPYVPYSYLNTPSSAVVHSARFNNAFAYNSIENHAYVPTTHPIVYYYYTYPTFTYDFSPIQPGAVNPIPNYPLIPNYPPQGFPQGGGPQGFPQGGGIGPNRPPIDVEDPADNLPGDEIKQQNGNNNNNENNDDDDTVTIEAL